MSPTQRTIALLKKQGYRAAIVERWNPHAKVRNDLFGFIDVLAVSDSNVWRVARAADDKWVSFGSPHTLAIQATTGANMAARVKKIRAAEALSDVLAAGWRVECWGWRKLKKSGRWECRVERIQ